MTLTWLPGAHVHDLHPGIGNGPFQRFLGLVLHVNVDEYGTPDSFWGNGNPGQVCPNFQVYKDGSIHQMLPLDWQPWCQVDGNFNYAAVETAGMPNEPLTDAQLASVARIAKAYHDEMGMQLKIANAPGQPGLGIHSMGGQAWGGHSCPGTIRANQRGQILALAGGATPTPEDDMSAADVAAINKHTDEQIAALRAEVDHTAQGLAAAISAAIHGDAKHPNSLDSLAAGILGGQPDSVLSTMNRLWDNDFQGVDATRQDLKAIADKLGVVLPVPPTGGQ